MNSSSKVLVIGDIMLDRYIEGSCERISPEAPVPILHAEKETYKLGGAANVAHNLQNLGKDTILIGGIGIDEYATHLQSLLRDTGIIFDLVDDLECTTVKTRIIAKSQQMLRVDREKIYSPTPRLWQLVKSNMDKYEISMIVISDYNKGIIYQELCNQLHKNYPTIPVLVDPKGDSWEKYEGSFLIKPNLKEFNQIAPPNNSSEEDLIARLKQFHKLNNYEHIIVTRSSDGMIHCDQTGTYKYMTSASEVYDVTGAGDTALSVLAYNIANGESVKTAIIQANKASSFVISKNKTYALSKDEYERL